MTIQHGNAQLADALHLCFDDGQVCAASWRQVNIIAVGRRLGLRDEMRKSVQLLTSRRVTVVKMKRCLAQPHGAVQPDHCPR